jgi:hypothetical protein
MAKDLAFYMHIDGFDGFDKSIDFDKKQIRRAMKQAGKLVTKDAQKAVGKTMKSAPGQYPGRRSGLLQRSIKAKVSRSGFLVRVAPQMVPGMKQFYPAFLWYGVRRKPGAKRDKRSKGSASTRIEPRGNYMIDTLEGRSQDIRTLLADAFGRSLTIK